MSDTFSARLICWQRRHGRHHLPWQNRNPYHIWLSEIMLQQTQVSTVLNYYPRFLTAFPTVADLAAAPEDKVLGLWAGLGYYSRARNLHQAAKQIMQEFGGHFPDTRQQLETLSGVGRSTAAAIAAFAFLRRETILDGNVKRVLCRVFALDGDPSDKAFERSLWQLAESLLPQQADDMPAYTQGLMDLGATVCRRSKPLCTGCPMQNICIARAENRTDDLPRKKSPPAVRQQSLYWLLLRRGDGSILLGKRPSKGIWAGLYCVPCFEHLQDLYDFAALFGLEGGDLQEAAAFTHRLTHRLLEITPFSATALNPPEQEIKNYTWICRSALADYGLPKPLSDQLIA